MCHNGVGADENKRVGQFQIFQCIAGRVVAKSLLVAYCCRRHAKTCITIDIGLQIVSHYVAEDCELFQGQLLANLCLAVGFGLLNVGLLGARLAGLDGNAVINHVGLGIRD